jgi:putative DNA primase/helicase
MGDDGENVTTDHDTGAKTAPEVIPIAEVRRQVKKRRAAEAAAGDQSGAPDSSGPVDSEFIAACMRANELGDGALFAAINRGRYLFCKSSGQWFRWTGHAWETDIMDGALAAVETVVDRLLDEADALGRKSREAMKQEDNKTANAAEDLRSGIFKRIQRLRTEAGRNKALMFSHTIVNSPMATRRELFDIDPWLLGVKNGVVNLKTGELRPGRAEDMITRACPHDWTGIDTPAPTWLDYLAATHEGNQDLIDFLGRLLGYAITGLTTERNFVILHGQGRNGKGTLVETLLHVLGPLAAPIQSELLLDQGRSRSSAGPSSDIMDLKGLRLAFASETDEGRAFSASRVKWLSGGDTLVGRRPYDRAQTSFRPSHQLFLMTNHKPRASAYDFAFWERTVLIPYNLSFVLRDPAHDNERAADAFLYEKLMAEAPGILAWLVRGCIRWQERGLDPPAIVREACQNYRREEDLISDFIEACCYRDERITTAAADLWDTFRAWFETNVSKKLISQKRFGTMMTGAGFSKIKSGTYYYQGLGILVK